MAFGKQGSDDDDRLIAEMLAPPPLEQTQASLQFWQRRRRALPFYRRGARREAERRAPVPREEVPDVIEGAQAPCRG